MLEVIKSEILQGMPAIQHGFFTKKGGVSTGIYTSLNCSYESKDSPENVRENRQRVMNYFNQPFQTLTTVYDIHGTKTVVVEEPWSEQTIVEADGMVTQKTGVVLGTLGADCPTVLFADATAKIIGSAHAGWKGARGGIIQSVVSQMIALGATVNNIHAVISPCIGQNSYEVDNDYYQSFCDDNSDNQHLFIKAEKPDHFLFDLRAYVASNLMTCGITHSSSVAVDTYQDEERFYSYRRSTHRNEADYGCHLSCIYLM